MSGSENKLTSKLTLAKEVIINNIIDDTYQELKEHFKPEELKGLGVVPKFDREKSKKAINSLNNAAENPAAYFGIKPCKEDVQSFRQKNLKILEISDASNKFENSPHEKKALEVLDSYLEGFSLSAEEQKIIDGMYRKVEDSNINKDFFEETLNKHVENDMQKFSDAAILSSK